MLLVIIQRSSAKAPPKASLTIPGVGSATRRKLLRRFGSMRAVRRASQTEICDAIGQALGTRVYEAFCYQGGDKPQL